MNFTYRNKNVKLIAAVLLAVTLTTYLFLNGYSMKVNVEVQTPYPLPKYIGKGRVSECPANDSIASIPHIIHQSWKNKDLPFVAVTNAEVQKMAEYVDRQAPGLGIQTMDGRG
jgi:mannosyltransferase OCH1-like enzyme